MVVVNSDQAFMALFLFICVLFNLWFVFTSSRRAFFRTPSETKPQSSLPDSLRRYTLMEKSVFVMSAFDIPWVWLCFVQCVYNTFTVDDSFHQSSGEDSFGCVFMGWYSSFSLVSMMGSNCLVAYYLWNYLRFASEDAETPAKEGMATGRLVKIRKFLDTTTGFGSVAFFILVAACLFASMPLMQGDGYLYTSGGFCYADFTNAAQSTVILVFVLSLMSLSTYLWLNIGCHTYWYFYAVFFVTWAPWIPAASYGIATGGEIAYPYMLVGAIVGHANALINPILYGWHLFRKLDRHNADDSYLVPGEVEGLKG